jgi:HSP20 family protein
MNLTVKKRNGDVPSLFSDWFDTNSFFSPLLNNFEGLMSPKQIGVTMPSANIKETDHNYCIELAAPGFDRKDFQIELEDNILTISSVKKDEKEEKGSDYTRREYSFSSFSRSFQLPDNTKDDNVDAHYEDGILKVTVPKKESTVHKPKKRIEIK